MSSRAPRLLAISDLPALGELRLEGWIDLLAESRVDTLLLRERTLSDRSLFDLALRVRRLVAGRLRTLVSARADLALAAGLDGVHLPSHGLPTAALRRWLGPRAIIGRSTHSAREVAAAARDGADYVVFGPVFPTPSKAAWGAAQGVAALAEVTGLGVPVLALGGLDAQGVAAVCDVGAHGIAGIRVFREPVQLAALVAAVRDPLRDSGQPSARPAPGGSIP